MTDKKMNAKQKIVGGFNLDAFVKGADQPESMPSEAEKSLSRAVAVKKEDRSKERRQKPPTAISKPQKEMLTARVQVKITQREMDKLQEKIGMVPVSVYLRNFLKEQGLI